MKKLILWTIFSFSLLGQTASTKSESLPKISIKKKACFLNVYGIARMHDSVLEFKAVETDGFVKEKVANGSAFKIKAVAKSGEIKESRSLDFVITTTIHGEYQDKLKIFSVQFKCFPDVEIVQLYKEEKLIAETSVIHLGKKRLSK